MIDYSAPRLVSGAPAAAEPMLMISSSVRSCDAGTVCGDRAITLPLRSGRTAFVLLDIAGHGASRAFLSSAVANEIVRALMHDESPASALGRADRLLQTIDDESPYAVAFAAVVDPALQTLVYASAGHDVAFLLADNGTVRHLMTTAPMLGIPLVKNAFDSVLMLEPSDTLVIVTDGISDSRRAGSEEFFGASRAALAVTRSRIDGRDPSRAILEAARAYEGGVQADDHGAIVVHVRHAQRPRRTPQAVRSLDQYRSSARPMNRGVRPRHRSADQ